jgi:hypothetical protein
MKSQVYKKSYNYPSYWSDEDKINFDLLVKESKRIYPNIEDYLINLAVHHYINVGLGKANEINKDDIEDIPLDLKSLFTETVEVDA